MFLIAGMLLLSTMNPIVGMWRGSSVCTDRKAAPACKDEQVIYEITPVSDDKVTVKADKIVDGKRETMGVLDFTRTKTATWTTEIHTPRVDALWELNVDGDSITGTMTQLPAKAVVRRMTLQRITNRG